MNASKTVRLPSVIDTISSGFRVVNRRLWVLVIPFILDLLYWLGPRQSAKPLIDSFVSLARALEPQVDARQLEEMARLGTAVPFDLSPFASLPSMLPKFINLLTPLITPPPPPIVPPTWYIGGLGTLMGVAIVANLISMLLAAIYLVGLAGPIRDEQSGRFSLREMLRVYGSFLMILLVLLGVALLVFVPAVMVAALTSQVSLVIGSIISLISMALLFWLLFTASFAFDAVVISKAGPLRALLSSVFVVQRSFGSAFSLFLVGWIILWGLSFAWQIVASTDPGLIVAMLGSAYISSGLAAAHLIFFRDRAYRAVRRTERGRLDIRS